MSDPQLIKEIQAAVTIPVMAKVRIGHFVEAQACFLPLLPFFLLVVQIPCQCCIRVKYSQEEWIRIGLGRSEGKDGKNDR